MLRITVLNDAGAATFKMEGKLAHEWVAEAEKAWAAFSNIPQEGRVVVDLCGVSFVDDTGCELLAWMHSSGAKLVGTGPMTSALIEEICGGERPPLRKWIQSALSLFFLLLLIGSMAGNKSSSIRRQILPSGDAPSAIEERIVRILPSVRSTSVLCGKSGVMPFRKGLSR